MRGAILLVVAGVWVLTQVFGGDALGRLGIAGAPVASKSSSTAGPPAPGSGPPGTINGPPASF